jgi:hypothetical protein
MMTASFFTFTGPGRVSIARYAPKFTPAGYETFQALEPGPWFRSVTREKYVELYHQEVLAKLDPRKTLDDLQRLAHGAEPVLLCWEKPPFEGDNFCHRRLVAQWFGDLLGIDVPEHVPPPKPPKRGRKRLVLPGFDP